LIYGQFVKLEYTEVEPDIIITRNEPMTYCSDKDSVAYVAHGVSPTEGYIIDKLFEDEELSIEVWLRQDIDKL
jgi:hypothetical protein